MITATLTREEAQQVLYALEFDGFTAPDVTHNALVKTAIETLRACLAEKPNKAYEEIQFSNDLTLRWIREGNEYVCRMTQAQMDKYKNKAEKEQEPVTTDFLRRTNDEYAAWCKTYYQADALDEFGMASLHGLWAWQEQERRKTAAEKSQQKEQEPVAWIEAPIEIKDAYVRAYLWDRNLVAIDAGELKRLPIKREWQGLTDEEINELWRFGEANIGWDHFETVAREVEAKLKEKNT